MPIFAWAASASLTARPEPAVFCPRYKPSGHQPAQVCALCEGGTKRMPVPWPPGPSKRLATARSGNPHGDSEERVITRGHNSIPPTCTRVGRRVLGAGLDHHVPEQ